MKRLSIAIILSAVLVFCIEVYAQEITRVQIDTELTSGTISPLLFGHNLEITRRGVWQGLSAEMVANRKFAASENGLPKRWSIMCGNGQVMIDDKVAYAGKESVRIEVKEEGKPCGITQTQETFAFQKDTKYVLRLWLKTNKDRTVRMRLSNTEENQVIFEKSWPVKPEAWQLVSEEFTAPATSEKNCLEISSWEFGMFWIGAVSLQPANAFHGMRRDVITLLKQIKPGILRYPGGCYAEFYKWQEGLLPVDQRPPIGPLELDFVLPNTDHFDSHEIGIDEFMALCREVGCEPAITTRLCEKTPEDAAAWVEYCNGTSETKWGKIRSQRGQTAPYNVKYWFVGNELYYFGRGGLKESNVCACQTSLFASAMKKTDPSIQLIGCTQMKNIEWNNSLLGQAGEILDLFSVHDYLQDYFKGDLSGIAKAPTRIIRPILLNAKENLLKENFNKQRKGLVFDEWNIMWGQKGSVGMGLYAAGMLNLFCRESKQLGLKIACFFMPVNEGAIQVTPQRASLDTAGEIFKLFKVHQGNLLLKTPEVLPATDLDLCASTTPEGKSIYITIVNQSSNDRTVELQLHNFAGQTNSAAVNFLIPNKLAVDEKGFRKLDEVLEMASNKILSLKIPPCAIARVRFGEARLPD